MNERAAQHQKRRLPCNQAESRPEFSTESDMGRYGKGEHVKIEVVDDHSGESEWMWLLVDHSDDDQQLVFGKLDSEPVAITDMRLGQELAVSYDKIRQHRTFD